MIKSRILYKDSQKGISTRTLCRFLVSTILTTIVLLSSVNQAFSASSLIKVSQNFFPICPSRASQNFCPSSILPNSVFRPDLQASHENFFPICLNRASQIFGSSSLLLNFAFWSDLKASQKILPPIDLGRASQTFWQSRPLLKFNFRPDSQANPKFFTIFLVRASQVLCPSSILAKFTLWPTLWASQKISSLFRLGRASQTPCLGSSLIKFDFKPGLKANQKFFPNCLHIIRPDLEVSNENFLPICLSRASQICGSSSILLNFAFWPALKANQKISLIFGFGRASQLPCLNDLITKFVVKPDVKASQKFCSNCLHIVRPHLKNIHENFIAICLGRASQICGQGGFLLNFTPWPNLKVKQKIFSICDLGRASQTSCLSNPLIKKPDFRANSRFFPNCLHIFSSNLKVSHGKSFLICLGRASQSSSKNTIMLKFAFWPVLKANQKILLSVSIGRAGQTPCISNVWLKGDLKHGLKAKTKFFPIFFNRASQMSCPSSLLLNFNSGPLFRLISSLTGTSHVYYVLRATPATSATSPTPTSSSPTSKSTSSTRSGPVRVAAAKERLAGQVKLAPPALLPLFHENSCAKGARFLQIFGHSSQNRQAFPAFFALFANLWIFPANFSGISGLFRVFREFFPFLMARASIFL